MEFFDINLHGHVHRDSAESHSENDIVSMLFDGVFFALMLFNWNFSKNCSASAKYLTSNEQALSSTDHDSEPFHAWIERRKTELLIYLLA